MQDQRQGDRNYECEVYGGILLVTRMQRWFGLAPVHIRKRGSKYYISKCRLYLYLGYIFALLHCGILLAATILDISLKDTVRTLHFGSPSISTMWSLYLANTMLLYLSGCFGAEKRMNNFMYYIKETDQINLLINKKKEQAEEFKNVGSVIMQTVWTIVGTLLHYYVIFMNQIRKKSELLVFYLNSVENTQCLHIFSLRISYTYTIQLFNVCLHNINCQLENVLTDVKNNAPRNNEGANVANPPLKLSRKSVNRAIDRLGVAESRRPASALSEENEEKLHQLLRHYDRVCALIRLLNAQDGLLLLQVITSNILYMVFANYNTIATVSIAEFNVFWVCFYCCQFVWISLICVNIMMIASACQRTTTEINECKRIVSCLMSYVTDRNDPLHKLMDTYYYRLRLENVQYSPLGLITIDGNLLFTIMSGVLTFVIIFIDFKFDTGFA